MINLACKEIRELDITDSKKPVTGFHAVKLEANMAGPTIKSCLDNLRKMKVITWRLGR